MPDFFKKEIFFKCLLRLWEQSGLSKMDFYDKIGIRNAFSVYAPAKPGQKQRKVNAPSVETLLKISNEFHVSVNYLLTGVEDSPTEGHPAPGKDYVDLPAWNQAPLDDEERELMGCALDVLRSGDKLPNVATALETSIKSLRDTVERDANRPRPRAPSWESPGSQKQASGGGQQGKRRANGSG